MRSCAVSVHAIILVNLRYFSFSQPNLSLKAMISVGQTKVKSRG